MPLTPVHVVPSGKMTVTEMPGIAYLARIWSSRSSARCARSGSRSARRARAAGGGSTRPAGRRSGSGVPGRGWCPARDARASRAGSPGAADRSGAGPRGPGPRVSDDAPARRPWPGGTGGPSRIAVRRGRDGTMRARTIARPRPAYHPRSMPTTDRRPARPPPPSCARWACWPTARCPGDAPSRPAARASSSSSWPPRWPPRPIEMTRVGKWLERVPELRLDGARPVVAGAGRPARRRSGCPARWSCTSAPSSSSIGGRLAAMDQTALGDRRPSAAGYWLKTLRDVPLRVWWSADRGHRGIRGRAARGVRGRRVGSAERAGRDAEADRAAPALRQPAPTDRRAPPDRHQRSAPARAGGRADPADARRPAARTATPRAPTASRPSASVAAVVAQPAPGQDPPRADPRATRPRRPAIRRAKGLTAEGAARLQAELRELTEVKRPEVIARIRAAKELGDLKENADYTAAREEQSFLEGRVQALEARLRDAVVVDAPVAGAGANLGSRVTVEVGRPDRHLHAGQLGRGRPERRDGCRRCHRSARRCWAPCPATR